MTVVDERPVARGFDPCPPWCTEHLEGEHASPEVTLFAHHNPLSKPERLFSAGLGLVREYSSAPMLYVSHADGEGVAMNEHDVDRLIEDMTTFLGELLRMRRQMSATGDAR
jgi:hypothetical protein